MKSYWRQLISSLPAKAERKIYELHFKNEHLKRVKRGSLLPVSNLSKQRVLQEFQRAYYVDNFVETGTYFGDTLYSLYPYFDHLYSIELSNFFFLKAKKRFRNLNKVELLQGDSSRVLKEIVSKLGSRAIFWLDGHYSGGITAKGDKECPVFEELQCIFTSPFENLIFIDDAREFIGRRDYPTIEELKVFVKIHKPLYSFKIENDCVRLLPPSA